MPENPQNDWVARALGVAVGSAAASAKVLPIWTEAKDRVDAQIAAIQQALRGSGDPVGQALADRGLPAFTRDTLVPLTAALMDADAASGPDGAPARKRAADRVAALKETLAGHPGLPLLENNPYGVEVRIFATLVPALDQIVRLCEG